MQYGSIGWSVGATLGYAQAATDKRVIACIGDGSFQVRNIIGKKKHYIHNINVRFQQQVNLFMLAYLGDSTRYFNNDPLWTKKHHLSD